MYNQLKDIAVLRHLLSHPLFLQLQNAGTNNFSEGELLYNLFADNAENDVLSFICHLILVDENAFSVTCANGKAPSPYLERAYENDLNIIFNTINLLDDKDLFNKGKPAYPFDAQCNAKASVKNLITFYKQYGYGMFIDYKAFSYTPNGLVAIANTSPITLDELKNYQYEKKLIRDNIVNFVSGLPYSHMLLYGDRGTGKSSTIHAMLNEFYKDGLRIIELNKENMLHIPKIRALIANNPLKFIIFIDDLSLGEYDDKVSSLKASLEGSVSSGTDNAMIVATSNRRHIVKESFNDRENSVHPTDSMSEQLSLSDRFGLTVNFSTTDKAEYISIILQLAADKDIKTDKEKLTSLAERWALIKGGRSPRRAKQFIDLVYSCEKRGTEIDF
jgi:hypothetical protein